MNHLESEFVHLSNCVDSWNVLLEDLHRLKELLNLPEMESQIMIPMGKYAFTPGTVPQMASREFTVCLGAGIFVKMTREETTAFLHQKTLFFQQLISEATMKMNEISTCLSSIQANGGSVTACGDGIFEVQEKIDPNSEVQPARKISTVSEAQRRQANDKLVHAKEEPVDLSESQKKDMEMIEELVRTLELEEQAEELGRQTKEEKEEKETRQTEREHAPQEDKELQKHPNESAREDKELEKHPSESAKEYKELQKHANNALQSDQELQHEHAPQKDQEIQNQPTKTPQIQRKVTFNHTVSVLQDNKQLAEEPLKDFDKLQPSNAHQTQKSPLSLVVKERVRTTVRSPTLDESCILMKEVKSEYTSMKNRRATREATKEFYSSNAHQAASAPPHGQSRFISQTDADQVHEQNIQSE